jgi:hypothetical protein
MAAFIDRVKNWIHPVMDVPEEDECYKEACSLRQSKADELRAKLRTDPELEAKLNHISNMLQVK